MGSGSSKSKRRIINFCGHQPLHPTEIPKGESALEGRVACEQKESNERRTRATQPVLETKDSRHPPVDPDLQLLDDILMESEDCLSWREPICTGQNMTNLSHTSCISETLTPGQENQRKDTKVLKMQRITPASEENLDRLQNLGDSCSEIMPGTRRVFELENNNLPKQSHTCPIHLETETPMAYDDTEEALMDSIEQEYSQFPPIPPVSCRKI